MLAAGTAGGKLTALTHFTHDSGCRDSPVIESRIFAGTEAGMRAHLNLSTIGGDVDIAGGLGDHNVVSGTCTSKQRVDGRNAVSTSWVS